MRKFLFYTFSIWSLIYKFDEKGFGHYSSRNKLPVVIAANQPSPGFAFNSIDSFPFKLPYQAPLPQFLANSHPTRGLHITFLDII